MATNEDPELFVSGVFLGAVAGTVVGAIGAYTVLRATMLGKGPLGLTEEMVQVLKEGAPLLYESPDGVLRVSLDGARQMLDS